MDNARSQHDFAAIILSLAYAAFAALIFMELGYSGYGETGPSQAAGWLLFFAGWLTVVVASLLIASSLGAHRGLVVGLAAIAWPPAVMAAGLFVFFSSCAGYGPHTCAFS